jgi:integrase
MTARWGQRAGVLGCTPHRFRHSFATKLLRITKDLRVSPDGNGRLVIAALLGRAYVSST